MAPRSCGIPQCVLTAPPIPKQTRYPQRQPPISRHLKLVRKTGCTGLISAGYKITWDKGAEEEGEGEEGAEGREVKSANEVIFFRECIFPAARGEGDYDRPWSAAVS